MLSKEQLSIDLAGDQLEALDRLVRDLDGEDRPIASIRPDQFRDAGLDEALRAVEREVKFGHGLAFLRGIPTERYSDEQIRRMFWGIGTFFGRTVSQSGKGDHLGEVIAKPGGLRGYDSDAELSLHNDLAELVSLLCVQPARSGGENRFVDMLAVREIVASERPDYLAVLEQGFWLERAPTSPHYRKSRFSDRPVPVFSEYRGVRSCWLVLPDRARRDAAAYGVPLTALQEDALAFLDHVVHADELAFTSSLERGEAVFICNYEVVHSRTPFVQFDEPGKARRLLRIWLQGDPPRPLSPAVTLYPNASGMQGMDPVPA